MNRAERNESVPAGLKDPDGRDLYLTDQGDRLLRAAFLLCRDEAVARDLVQETFCAALGNKAPFRGDSRPFTWLYAILYRRFLTHLRREKRRRRLLDGPASDPGSGDGGATFLRRHRLLDALEHLPRRQRDVVMLRFVEEMTLAEIAAVQRVPLGTVKSRLHHGMAALRRRILTPLPGGRAGVRGDEP